MVDSSKTRSTPITTKTTAMAASPCLSGSEKRPWWLTNRKIVDKYIKEARNLIESKDQSEIAAAINLLDAALVLSPRYEVALELKARSLLYLRRFKDVADMLQEYIPSLKMANEDCSLGSTSSADGSQQLSMERVKLLTSGSESPTRGPSFKCFSVSDLKKNVMARLCKSCEKEGQWRYLVLGQACYHLGLMEDAIALLQTGKRLSTAAFRRESISWSDDSFSLSDLTITTTTSSSSHQPLPESETITTIISHIKLLLRRRSAAIAAMDAGLQSEAIRHFTKILDSRRGAPQGFLSQCYFLRASAYKSLGRIAESISDCNKTLALDPTSIQALETRASLLESIRCLPDSLPDLEHLKLLYNSILRDKKLPGPTWKKQNISYREIPGKLCALTARIQKLKERVAGGNKCENVDYHALIGLRRGCTRSELERAHRLLVLRHKPDKATSFMERCEFADERDSDSIRDRAKMSALLLYRLIQRGYSSLLALIKEEEEKKLAAAVLQVKMVDEGSKVIATSSGSTNPLVFQGVFCRDLATVGNLLSRVGFNCHMAVKYEALSC